MLKKSAPLLPVRWVSEFKGGLTSVEDKPRIDDIKLLLQLIKNWVLPNESLADKIRRASIAGVYYPYTSKIYPFDLPVILPSFPSIIGST